MIAYLLKSVVAGHYRTEASGKRAYVPEYNDSRTKKNVPVSAPNGRDNFGMIQGECAMKAGIPPGPIMLYAGTQISEHHGFGREHIKQQHGEEIRKAGFKSEEEFVADVAKSFNAVYKVGDNRYALVADGRQQKIHIIELTHDHGKQVYSVITAYVAERKDFHKRRFPLLWGRAFIKSMVEAYNRTSHDGKMVHVNAYTGMREPSQRIQDVRAAVQRKTADRANFMAAHGQVMIRADELPHMPGFMAILHRSAKQPGKWQLTYFHGSDATLPNNDLIRDDYEDLLKELQSDGVVLMEAQTMPQPVFAKALQALRYCFGK